MENQESARKSAMEKIRKLLAVAGNEAANEQEAATAARLAESLMNKYQVDSAEVTLDEITRDDAFDRLFADVSFEGIPNYVSKAVPSWVGYIGLGVGKLHTCKVDIVHDRTTGVKIRFSGYAPDVLVAKWTYQMLCETVYRLSKLHGKGMGMAFNKSFRIGAAGKLQSMLMEMQRAREQENKLPETSSMALVVMGNKIARVNEMYGEQRTSKGTSTTSSRSGYEAGRNAAAKINIASNAVGSTNNSKRLN